LQKLPDELLQYYKICPEYGTTFISEMILCAPHFVGSDLDSIEILSAYPPCAMEIWCGLRSTMKAGELDATRVEISKRTSSFLMKKRIRGMLLAICWHGVLQ
jgi:hypothetical protein